MRTVYSIFFIFISAFSQLNIADSYPVLWESHNAELQTSLEKLITRQGLWKQIQTKHLSIALVNISDLKHPQLAELNGNQMFYAASLPKLAILLAVFVEIELGNLEETDGLNKHLIKMIRHSNNASASHVLSLIGGERILEIIQSPKFALYDKNHNGGLWIGKAYSKKGAFHRDPLYNLSHGATAIQVARFYYLLEVGQLLNAEYSKKIKEVLSKSGINHKFVKGLQGIPNIALYRKSGSWKNFHADSVMVEYKDYKYILVGLSDSAAAGNWYVKLAKPIHEIISNNKLLE